MWSYVLAFISIFLGAGAQLMLKRGSSALAGGGGLVDTVMRAMTSPFLIGGFALYGASAVLWVVVLSKMKLSIAYPLVAFSYVIVVIASYVLFHESVAWNQWLALGFIVAGVLLLIK